MDNNLELNIQRFAEEAEDNTNSVNEETGAEAEVLTFDEILADKTYQAEFDRRLAKATETAVQNAKSKWDKEQADKVAEEQKLATMDELQKKDYEIDNLKKQLADRDRRDEARDLKLEAIKQASEKGIPIEVMNELDYTHESAESIFSKLEVYSKAFQSAKTNAIENYSKEPAPQTGEDIPPESNKTGYEKFEEQFIS